MDTPNVGRGYECLLCAICIACLASPQAIEYSFSITKWKMKEIQKKSKKVKEDKTLLYFIFWYKVPQTLTITGFVALSSSCMCQR